MQKANQDCQSGGMVVITVFINKQMVYHMTEEIRSVLLSPEATKKILMRKEAEDKLFLEELCKASPIWNAFNQIRIKQRKRAKGT